MNSITQDVYCKRKVQKLYDFTLSSRVWSDGGFVAFRAVCWGNCSRKLWIELAVCHVCITTVCIATDRENKSTIRMSAKIDYQLRQVCLSVFLPAWKYWVKTRRIFMKCNTHTHTHIYIYIYIYIRVYEDFSKMCRKFKLHWIMRRKQAMYMTMYSRCSYGYIWIVIRINSVSDKICTEIQNTHFVFSKYSPKFSFMR